ncbi:MAG: ribosome-associated translation inhibitor RaiA [bacterium]|nr:ribosome-associated translation inhibitor RaiA [bacterium]
MNLDIKATNLELTPAIKQYIETKISGLSKFLEKWEKSGKINVKFELARTTNHHSKGEVFYAEMNLNLGEKMLRAEHSAEDAYKAIDKVKDIMKEEIIEFKEKSE